MTNNKDAEQLLRSLVVLQDKLDSLAEYVAVNTAALSKTQKKVRANRQARQARQARQVRQTGGRAVQYDYLGRRQSPHRL